MSITLDQVIAFTLNEKNSLAEEKIFTGLDEKAEDILFLNVLEDTLDSYRHEGSPYGERAKKVIRAHYNDLVQRMGVNSRKDYGWFLTSALATGAASTYGIKTLLDATWGKAATGGVPTGLAAGAIIQGLRDTCYDDAKEQINDALRRDSEFRQNINVLTDRREKIKNKVKALQKAYYEKAKPFAAQNREELETELTNIIHSNFDEQSITEKFQRRILSRMNSSNMTLLGDALNTLHTDAISSGITNSTSLLTAALTGISTPPLLLKLAASYFSLEVPYTVYLGAIALGLHITGNQPLKKIATDTSRLGNISMIRKKMEDEDAKPIDNNSTNSAAGNEGLRQRRVRQ